MISVKKFNFPQILKLISILLLINTSNLYPHNSINSGCNKQCKKNIKINKNQNKLNNFFYQLEIDIKNSCLNKSFCRG